MAYADSKIETILPLIVTRLISQLSLSTATCFLGDRDEEHSPNPGTAYYVVFPDGGRFDDSLFAGGGREQLCADAIFGVKIISRLMLDRPGVATQVFTHATHGLMPKMHSVLDALAAFEPSSGGNTLVREVVQPLDWQGPTRKAKDLSELIVRFGCLFDWDLS